MWQNSSEDSLRIDLLRLRLDAIIELAHELAKRTRVVAWAGLAEALASHYCIDNIPSGGSIRLM